MPAKVESAAASSSSPVSVSIAELQADSIPSSVLEDAFGPSSLGIIVVRDLPPEFVALRHRLLSYSSQLANLPEHELRNPSVPRPPRQRIDLLAEKLESPESKWLVGWSLGKETLSNGRYDTQKGSYYLNPVASPELAARARREYPNLPEYTAPNVWPDEAVLPGFRATFQDLCDLVVATAALVARACDRYAEALVPGYEAGYLERVVRSSVSTKARLLHYFPSLPSSGSHDNDDDDASRVADDNWCATHVDHGCLTGLTSAMFVDEAANRDSADGFLLPELAKSPDPKAGLYIHSRAGAVTKVNIPRDCLAFQTGETLEVVTKGRFRAVPHFVRGATAVGEGGARVARNTLAVFTQPNLWEMVDEKRDFATFAKEIVERNH